MTTLGVEQENGLSFLSNQLTHLTQIVSPEPGLENNYFYVNLWNFSK